MSKMQLTFEFKLDSTKEILEKRGLENSGRAQQILDSEVLRYCDPYVPFDTGMLKDSGITATQIGSGEVEYNTPYAAKQYYNNGGGEGLRGGMWFARMKIDHKDDLQRTIAAATGGKI